MKSQTAMLRQEAKPEYTMNGGLYLFGWDYFKTHKSIYHSEYGVLGWLMPDELSVEIDELRDLHYAEFLVERNYVDITMWLE
jgi:CMP-N-acetylneuraminic acid synthetase